MNQALSVEQDFRVPAAENCYELIRSGQLLTNIDCNAAEEEFDREEVPALYGQVYSLLSRDSSRYVSVVLHP